MLYYALLIRGGTVEQRYEKEDELIDQSSMSMHRTLTSATEHVFIMFTSKDHDFGVTIGFREAKEVAGTVLLPENYTIREFFPKNPRFGIIDLDSASN